MLNPSLLIEGLPVFFDFFKKLKEKTGQEGQSIPQTFLLYGSKGKEFSAIKLMQLLNCKDFFHNHHNLFECPICKEINSLKEQSKMYSILTEFNWEHFHILIKAYTSSNEPSHLLREELVHDLHKTLILLNQSLNKPLSTTKGLSEKKLEELVTKINQLIVSVNKGTPLSLNEASIMELQITLSSLNYNPNIDYIENIHHKLFVKSIHLPYQFLFIKDPAHLTPLALNSLLKLIEEPPNRTIIIFVTSHLRSILPTILSRCIKFKITPYSKNYHDTITQSFPDMPLIDLLQISRFRESNSIIEEHLPPLNEESPLSEILYYYEKLASQFSDLSPISLQKKTVINQIIDGGKNYSLNQKHLYDVLQIFLNRIQK